MVTLHCVAVSAFGVEARLFLSLRAPHVSQIVSR